MLDNPFFRWYIAPVFCFHKVFYKRMGRNEKN